MSRTRLPTVRPALPLDMPDAEVGNTLMSVYRLEAELGPTSTGYIFAAMDLLLGRPVLIKLAPKGQASGVLLAEARRCAMVGAPAALAIHTMGVYLGHEYVVAEGLVGEPLAQALQREAWPAARILTALRSVAAGVSSAHRAGFATGTLSGASLMLAPEDRLVLGRYALGRVAEAPTLLAPEVARGDVAADDPSAAEAIDLYNIGALAIELACGVPLFDGDLAAHGRMVAPRLTDLRTELPSELADLVAWLLDKRPAARPRSARDVTQQLDAILVRHQPKRPTLRVLVVDDDLARARWLRNLARRADGHALVETAADGPDAGHKINRDQPDLVIVNAQLGGGMNALEFCLYVRGLPTATTCKLLVYGHIADADAEIMASLRVAHLADVAFALDLLMDEVRNAAATLPIATRARRSTISG